MGNNGESFRKIANFAIVGILCVLTFFILQPVAISVITGLILSFLFYPLYLVFYRRFGERRLLAAVTVCGIVLAAVVVLALFVTPLVAKQLINTYRYLQNADFVTPLKVAFPAIFASPEVSQSLSVAISNFMGNAAAYLIQAVTSFLLNSPNILLHVVLVFSIFFYGLRDGDKFVDYLKRISPLSEESGKRVFKRFEEITKSVLYGQVIVGVIQGTVAGIGFFIFGVPNALTLTFVTIVASMLPMIGPWLIWVPVDIYLFTSGYPGAAIGLLVYSVVLTSWIDNLVTPMIVGRRAKLNSAVVLVSMIGGMLFMGILGLIIGPLIISYLLMLLEFYESEKNPKPSASAGS